MRYLRFQTVPGCWKPPVSQEAGNAKEGTHPSFAITISNLRLRWSQPVWELRGGSREGTKMVPATYSNPRSLLSPILCAAYRVLCIDYPKYGWTAATSLGQSLHPQSRCRADLARWRG